MRIHIPISLGVLHVWALGVEAAGGFLSLPLTRHTVAGGHSQDLVRRQTDSPLSLAYQRNVYFIDVDIGTPKQRVKLGVEVSGSGINVMGTCDTPYSFATECKKLGAYNASASTTSTFVGGDGFEFDEDENEATYDFARFNFYADDVTVAGQGTLKNETFRVYNSSEVYEFGTLGLGFGENGTAPSILDQLAADGFIGASAFGISLDSDVVASGLLVLGGVDTKKFSGALTKLPVVDAPQGVSVWELNKYWVNLDGVTTNHGNGSRTSFDGFTADIRISYTLTTLPSEIFIPVAEALGAGNWTDPNWSTVPCSRRDSVNGSLELELSGLKVLIPYANLLIPDESPDAKDGDCHITVSEGDYSTGSPIWSLGIPFLRSVYTVFDQDNKAIWMATLEDCGSEAVAFSEGSEVRGQCGSSSGDSSGGEGGTPDNNDDGSGGSRLGMDMSLILGAILVLLVV